MRFLTFLASRFVAGDNAQQAVEAVRKLNQDSLLASLDFLGENVSSRDEAIRATEEYVGLLKLIAQAELDCNVSVKLSQLGLGLDEHLGRDNLDRLLSEAARLDNFVRLDMEGSEWTQRTLDVFHSFFPSKYRCVGVVIQAMLKRSERDIQELVRAGARVRLCKGAYKEPPELAYQSREEVNASYDHLAKLLLKAPRPAFATHDDDRIVNAVQAARAAGLAPGDYEIQMLYGLRARRRLELARQGHAMRVYVPYGSHWFPYFYRRLRERKENIAFVLRNSLSQ